MASAFHPWTGRRNAGCRTHLVAANLLSHIVQRLDNLQSQFLPLLVLGDSDILDVSDQPQVMNAKNESAFQIYCSCGLAANPESVTYNFRSTSTVPTPTTLLPSEMTNM